MESYGTGIRKIFGCYRNTSCQPRIEVTPHTFKLILPNVNAPEERLNEVMETPTEKVCTVQEREVLNYLAEKGEMTDEDVQDLLEVKRTRAYLITREMCQQGLICREGRGADKHYRLKGARDQ